MPLCTASSGSVIRPPSDLLVGAPGTGTWTILVWFNLYRVTGTQTIWYLNDGHALRASGTDLQFVYGTGSDSITTVAANTWTCAVVTKNGTTEARYTVDGVYDSNRTTSLSNSDVANAYVGSWAGSTDWLNGGTVGPIKAWDRVLTASEIALESARWLPEFTSSLRLFWPLLRGYPGYLDGGTYAYKEDLSGNGRPPIFSGSFSSLMRSGPPIPWGATTAAVAEQVGAPLGKVTFAQRGRMELSSPGVTTTGGVELATLGPLIELAYDAAGDGKYSAIVPASHIRAVQGSTGFRGLRTYLSDNAEVELEIANTGGQYTDGGGLWIGMWCKVRLAGSGDVLFTGRITELTPAYGVSNPYLSVRLDTNRNALSIPARSVLLKETDVKAAVLALIDEIDLSNGGGFFIFDRSEFDGPDLLAPSGAEQVRTYGDDWMSLAVAGGYGKANGELNVLQVVADLMKAEDGRALWASDNMLELYSQSYLDDVRDSDPTYTLTDDEIANLSFSVGSEYINDLVLKWTPTRWSNETVYTYESTAGASITPGDYRDFSVSFRVSGSDRVVAAENPVVNITQTGPTVSYVWQGEIKATGGTLRVTNSSGTTAASITAISITADALIQSEVAEVHKEENLGKTLYGVKPLEISATLIDRETQATSRAQREFAMWNERASFINRIDLKPDPHDRALALRWLTLPFATPIRVKSDRLAHTARYLSIGSEWEIAEGGREVDVTLYLEPVVVSGLFTFDSVEKGFDAGRLA